MNVTPILAALDAEIASLRKARELLTSLGTPTPATSPRSTKAVKAVRKPMSPEARAKIAAAQKKRWAKQRKKA